jgi:hypothetical protein
MLSLFYCLSVCVWRKNNNKILIVFPF